MKPNRLYLAATAAGLFIGIAPAAAQQRVVTPEQRVERLERQLEQVQRQVFPRGAPAATAGFSDEPAATQASVRNLSDRLNALERQLADVLRQAEENGHRVSEMSAELTRLRSDQERRLASLEAAATATASTAPAAEPLVAASSTPSPTPQRPSATATPSSGPAAVASAPEEDPAELAYDEGYELWRSGRFDEAITSLRAFSSAYPKHRRTSWANNLAGRALLDKGQPRAAAEALLANYRSNPKGERAADSLFYLGQALMKLGQAAQACKAYAELEDVYGGSIRGELEKLLPPAKAQANCS